MAYRFLDDIAIADVAFEATGKSLDELFESAAMALENIQVKDLAAVGHKVKHVVKITGDDREMLLRNFLEELIFIKDTKQLVFSDFDVSIGKDDRSMSCTCGGEKLNPKTQELVVDAKAISMHDFKIEETRSGFVARVIVDV